jgi:RNA polymerase sigma-70 factor (ECF subfamily)
MIEASSAPDLSTARAWRELEAKLRPFVARRVHAQVDVDDVLQEVFLRMHRGLPSLRDDQRFGPWLYRVARSAIVDHLRSCARHKVNAGEPAIELSVEGEASLDEPDPRNAHQEAAASTAFFVALLPSPYREALTLTELEGLTQKQAAEMLGLSLSGMKSRVQRGRQKLRAALEQCCFIAVDARQRVIACDPRPDGKLPEGCCS